MFMLFYSFQSTAKSKPKTIDRFTGSKIDCLQMKISSIRSDLFSLLISSGAGYALIRLLLLIIRYGIKGTWEPDSVHYKHVWTSQSFPGFKVFHTFYSHSVRAIICTRCRLCFARDIRYPNVNWRCLFYEVFFQIKSC